MNCTSSYNGVITHVLPARMQEYRDVPGGIQYLAVAQQTIQAGHNIN